MNWAEIIKASPAIAVVIVLVGTIATYFKVLPELRRVKTEGDTSLRADLMARIAKLEAQVEAQDKVNQQQREDCDARVEEMQRQYEVRLTDLAGQVQVLRHERNNEQQTIQTLLMMLKHIKDSPDKIIEFVQQIEDMRAKQAQNVALEKGAMRAHVTTTTTTTT